MFAEFTRMESSVLMESHLISVEACQDKAYSVLLAILPLKGEALVHFPIYATRFDAR